MNERTGAEMINRDKNRKDERAMKAIREVFMQRIRSGIIIDALIQIPDWERRRRIPWPCRVYVLYKESDEKDIGWLHDRILFELRDAGLRENEKVRMSFIPLAPREARDSCIAERASAMNAISLKELDIDECLREARDNKFGFNQ